MFRHSLREILKIVYNVLFKKILLTPYILWCIIKLQKTLLDGEKGKDMFFDTSFLMNEEIKLVLEKECAPPRVKK